MINVYELTDLTELRACEELQRRVWSLEEREVVPASHLRAVQEAGGLVAGAELEGAFVGFVYAFPAREPAREPALGLHSHLLAVSHDSRGRGVGRALKWYQRAWALERGITWVSWTFDPLRAGNARLNLEHLGATSNRYLSDFYGSLRDGLNAGLPSDRLMALWSLQSPAVRRLEAGLALPEPPMDQAVAALVQAEGDRPGRPELELEARLLTVAAPPDIGRLMAEAPQLARSWRAAMRSALIHYFAAGYRATRFIGGAYLLEGPE